MKKTIKVKVCDFNTPEERDQNFILDILRQKYEVQLSDDPEYIIASLFGNEHLKYQNCVKILLIAEHVRPDFNLYDYAIGLDRITFNDRYFNLPVYLIDHLHGFEWGKTLRRLEMCQITAQDVEQKTAFCDFVYSNYLASPERENFFNVLSKYKKVDSGGRYLNNVGGPVADKYEFQKQHKFSIVFENTLCEDITSEKILDALAAKTIPIYWGNTNISREFNTKRIINVHDYPSFDAVVDYIKKVDNDSVLYYEILRQPVWAEGFDHHEVLKNFYDFLDSIIGQPLEQAKKIDPSNLWSSRYFRRAVYAAKQEAKNRHLVRIVSSCVRPFKKLKLTQWAKKIAVQKGFLKKYM